MREYAMAKERFEQFAMPNEVRAFVEQSVAQARTAFDGIAQAANRAVSQWHGHAEAARAGASEIAHKSMAYAEQNMAATFDFAQKLMRAKDPAEVLRLQSEYVNLQMRTLSTQAQELGQSAVKIVTDAAKPKL
jgi:phasin